MLAENLRPIVQSSDPRAAITLLRELGWGGELGRIDRAAGTPAGYHRLVLGADVTEAGTQQSATDIWWTGFQQGARYHLAVLNQSVRWYDFQERSEWSARWDGDLSALAGLAPGSFSATGRFEPHGAVLQSTVLPTKPPREYLTELVGTWWRSYLRWDAPRGESGALAQQRFVNLIARLVLVRTIEDVGGTAWLSRDTLRELAEAAEPAASLRSLFRELKVRINSQVFSEGNATHISSERVPPLLRALYDQQGRTLDFSAIEFNMIGRFYERVLGEHHAISDSKQMTLVGSQEREVVPISHRRELGQYYTPRVFADYIARKVVLPKVRIARTVEDLPRVADIAVGSGEMLNAALRVMLSVEKFRTPESVRHILQHKLVGIDINPTAIQLTALNLLRTAVLLCPSLLEQVPAFPKISALFAADGMSKSLKRQIGDVDVVITNPPFRGQPDWRADAPPSSTKGLGGRQSNKASAFLVSAVRILREDGRIGIVLPNQFFSSAGNKVIRERVLKDLTPIEILDNQGARVFEGVSNQPGVLIAATRPRVRPANLLVTTLAPTKEHQRSLLWTGVEQSPGISRVVQAPIAAATGTSSTWLRSQRRHDVATVPIKDLLANSQFTRSPIPTIGPLRELWSIKREGNKYVHTASGTVVDSLASPYICHVARPGGATGQHLMPCVVPDERILFPYVVDSDGTFYPRKLSTWKRIDRTVFDLGSQVVEIARSLLPLSRAEYENYRLSIADGSLHFYRLTGLRPGQSFILLSRMAHIQSGRETWPAWVFDSNTSVVPTSGLIAMVADRVSAQVIGALLNTRNVIEQLKELGAARGVGWVEVSPSVANQLEVPDIRVRAYQARIDSLKLALGSLSETTDPDAMTRVARCAESLWAR